TLAVGMLLGLAQLAHSQTTPCSAVQALKPGTCMTYTYAPPGASKPSMFVLCNGPYSLCSTANCTCTSGNCTQLKPGESGQAQCHKCEVRQTGLSIRTVEVPANKGTNSAMSNYGYTPNLEGKECKQAPLVNCLGVE